MAGPFGFTPAVDVGKSGSNVREFMYLPENVRDSGIPASRVNPINPLDQYAASRVMADSTASRFSRFRHPLRTRSRRRQMVGFTGGVQMLYSPAGRGSVMTG